MEVKKVIIIDDIGIILLFVIDEPIDESIESIFMVQMWIREWSLRVDVRKYPRDLSSFSYDGDLGRRALPLKVSCGAEAISIDEMLG